MVDALASAHNEEVHSASEEAMTASERDILRLERSQVSDFNRHNIKALLTQYTDKLVGFSSTRHERIGGRAALAKTFQHYLQVSPKVRYSISEVKVQPLGDTAVASFYWNVQLAPGHHVSGRGTHVLIKERGKWKIAHEHFSKSH
jgi:ketosteroid isomerase-like protein